MPCMPYCTAIFPSESPSSSHWNLVFPTSFHIDWITLGGTGTTRKATCLARNCTSFSHIRPHWYCWPPQVLSRWLFLTFIKKCHRDTPGMSDLLQRSTMHIPKKPTTFPTSCFRGSSLLQVGKHSSDYNKQRGFLNTTSPLWNTASKSLPSPFPEVAFVLALWHNQRHLTVTLSITRPAACD